MDTVIAWIDVLKDERERIITRYHADGHPYRTIGPAFGLTHAGARKVHLRALSRIAAAINRGRLKVPRGLEPAPLADLAA